MSFRLGAVLALLVSVPALGFAQRGKDVMILFKDGFRVAGRVIEKREHISDPSGALVNVAAPGAIPYLDDGVRLLKFSYTFVQDVIPKKPEDMKDLMVIKRSSSKNTGDKLLPGWEFEAATPWDNKWERAMTVKTSRGRFDIIQRITTMTPYQTGAISLGYNWSPNYLTQELGPDMVRSLLYKYYENQKELKEPEKRLNIAKFLYQAGWYVAAERELDHLIKEFRDQQQTIDPLRETIRDTKANLFAEDMDRARKLGQHTTILERLETMERDADLKKRLSDKNRVLVQDLKNHYDAAKEKLTQAKQALKDVPCNKDIAEILSKDLNHDTVANLETFITFAQQHLREIKDNKKPTQKADEVFALAITGWLQGDKAAEPDAKLARQLWFARQQILELQKTDGAHARAQIAGSLAKEARDVPIDMLARMIKMLPPPNAYDKISSEVVTVEIEVPDGASGSYLVQLPPDYHHHRAYPVLLLMHGARENAEGMLARFTGLAAHHGFILAAPLWGKGLRPSWGFSAQEHAIVLDSLRDLRRRFQVDSDRVFLFGWEQGGEAAWDIGLSHPDQFAGVLPMNGTPRYFALKYQTNGQYLPFYAVEGDQNRLGAERCKWIFKDWRLYPSIYVEYKGRGSEWFGAELPSMFDWMSRKKRRHPLKELGRHDNTGRSGEEFRTSRPTDNKFYWLSYAGLIDRHHNDAKTWDNKILPATVTASVHTGNELELKNKGEVKGAKIWYQINIRTHGVKQVTLSFTPNLIDYSKPLMVRINNAAVMVNKMVQPSVPVMLEEFYQSGDRQRLIYAKLDFKL